MAGVQAQEHPGSRIHALLDASPELTAELLGQLGLERKDVADLAAGELELSPTDLVTAADVLSVPVGFLAGTLRRDASLAVSLRLGTADGKGAPREALRYAEMLLRRLELLDFWQGQTSDLLSGVPRDHTRLYKEAGRRMARRLRAVLKLDDLPVQDLVQIVERCRIPVAFRPMPRSIHGINVRDERDGEPLRAIVVNSQDYWTRQRFTLAHELCHGLYDDAGQVIVDQVEVPETLPELRAEAFARHLLLPEGALQSEVLANRERGGDAYTLVAQVILTYGISRDAVLKALVDDEVVPSDDWRLARLHEMKVRDLMERTRNLESWEEQCAYQNEPSGSPLLVDRAVHAYGDGQIALAVVAELMEMPEAEAERQLAAAGW